MTTRLQNEAEGTSGDSGQAADMGLGAKDFNKAFEIVASFYGRPSSETVLFSGLPLDLPHPSTQQVERVAARIGLEVEWHDKLPTVLTKQELPLLVFMKSGKVVPLLEEVGENEFTTDTNSTGDANRVALGQFLKSDIAGVISFSVVYVNSSDRANISDAQSIEKKHWLRATLATLWRPYSNVALAALFINFLGLVTPIFVMNVYDRILPNQAISSLWVLGIGVMVALLFDLLLKTARSAIIDHTGKEADQKLSYLLFEKVLNSKLSSKPESTGEFSSRIGQYEFVREFFTSNTLSSLIDTVFIFVFFAVIYIIAGWVVLVPIVAFFATLIIGIIAQQRIKSKVARAANEAAQRNALLVESIGALENIKSMRAETQLLRKWTELTKKASRTSESIKQISAGASNSTQFVQQMVTVGLVISGAYAFANGEITTGAIIATVMLSGRAVAPLAQITMTLSRLHQAMLSLRILDDIMSKPEDIPSSAGFVNREVTNGSLEAKSLEFIYPETDHKVITDMNFSIRPGERVGIIGKIGSGKTTFGRLVCNLYEPSNGRLLIDGVDMRQYHPHEVRKAVSFAGQTAELFMGTLKENLLVAKPDATDKELIEVATKTGLDEFVSRHPKGFDMPVGERGDRLSGGQKQSVIIARLLLTDPKIVFLDEPSGSMDLASERILMKTLASSFSKETTLIISTHRYSMLELVDRLMVLDNGRLIADGPKDIVLKQLAERASKADPSLKAKVARVNPQPIVTERVS